MGLAVFENTTGRLIEWVRNGLPARTDPALVVVKELEECPPDDQRLDLGKDELVTFVAAPPQRELDTVEAMTKIDVALTDAGTSTAVKDALAAIKKLLA